jgi:hypothetical protein
MCPCSWHGAGVADSYPGFAAVARPSAEGVGDHLDNCELSQGSGRCVAPRSTRNAVGVADVSGKGRCLAEQPFGARRFTIPQVGLLYPGVNWSSLPAVSMAPPAWRDRRKRCTDTRRSVGTLSTELLRCNEVLSAFARKSSSRCSCTRCACISPVSRSAV